ncbi:hypothetical protein Salat_1791100 [Sesamum alatum]|uniref:Uncharacterized protein n=1 Tax=Sesamum alatum TaxID=300844 RepID=A0AAE1YA18_9LAMI|nr:hypothetical protein Salat_1791100 [Sesamum alatum]
MRDIQLQTPQRDQSSGNRRLKSTSEINKNLRKVTKKSLNPAFKAVSEEDIVVLESLKEFSEVSDDNPFAESAENFIISVNPAEPHSSETVAISDITSPSFSSSSVVTSDAHVTINASHRKGKNPVVDSSRKMEPIEAEVVIKHLREARIQVLNSKDVGPSKKLLDALIDIVIEEFYGGLYDEKEWLDKLLSNKANLVFLSIMLGIFAIIMCGFLHSGTNGYLTGPTPT